MASILILFAHPLLEKSRVHSELLKSAKTVLGVTINDLYDQYADFDIDVEREKKLLLEHDIIIWQHPLYWYSCPPLLKQWLDLVLEHGWAYGKKGTALTGKKVFTVLSTGGSMEAYQPGGYNKFAINDYLLPFERSAELCRMIYWPPYWVHSSHRMEPSV
ncbi:MAG TPA: NAD(P)H-dependent oxidoreductase, partial [Flavisolibacter sp.]